MGTGLRFAVVFGVLLAACQGRQDTVIQATPNFDLLKGDHNTQNKELKTENNCFKNKPNAPKRDVLGVWIASVDSYVMDSKRNISVSLDRLPKIGINTIFPVVWNKGSIFFKDDTLSEELGESPDFPPAYKDRDVLGEMLAKAQSINLKVLPWFEFGTKITADTPLFTRHPDWFMKNYKGESTESFDKYTIGYFNPVHPGVRSFFVRLFASVLRYDGVEGIQIDDHFSWPIEWGYDAVTVAAYRAENKGRDPPEDFKDPDWMRWRANKLTEAWAEIVAQVRLVKPDVRISLAPNIQRYAYEQSLQDWKAWMEKGLVDEIIMQNYKRQADSFASELEQDYVKEALKCVPFSVGVLAGVSTGLNSPEVIADQIKASWKNKMEGVTFFHYPFLVGKRPPEQQKKFMALFPEILQKRE